MNVNKRQVVNQLFSGRIWLRRSAGSVLEFLLGHTVSGWLVTDSSAGDYIHTHAPMSCLQVCSYFSSSTFVAGETFWLWLVSCVHTGEKWVTILTERLKVGHGLKKINRRSNKIYCREIRKGDYCTFWYFISSKVHFLSLFTPTPFSKPFRMEKKNHLYSCTSWK